VSKLKIVFLWQKKKMKKFSQLSDQEVIELKDLFKNGKTHRIRVRSHIILLTNEGKTVCELVNIFGFTIKTIYSIINNYIEKNKAGLKDSPRSGRPTAMTEEEEKFVLEMLSRDSRNLNKILSELKNRFNKIICKQTLIRFLKKKNTYGNDSVNP